MSFWRCCCEEAPGSVVVTVNGCLGAPIEGASVSATANHDPFNTIGPYLTGADGKVTVPFPTLGSWTINASGTSYHGAALVNVVSGVNPPVTINTTASAGHVCACGGNVPLSQTLDLTYSGGVVALTFVGSTQDWRGLVLVAGTCNGTSGKIQVQLILACTGGAWTLNLKALWTQQPDSSIEYSCDDFGTPACSFGSGDTTLAGDPTASPTAATGAFPATLDGNASFSTDGGCASSVPASLPSPLTGNLTITE